MPNIDIGALQTGTLDIGAFQGTVAATPVTKTISDDNSGNIGDSFLLGLGLSFSTGFTFTDSFFFVPPAGNQNLVDTSYVNVLSDTFLLRFDLLYSINDTFTFNDNFNFNTSLPAADTFTFADTVIGFIGLVADIEGDQFSYSELVAMSQTGNVTKLLVDTFSFTDAINVLKAGINILNIGEHGTENFILTSSFQLLLDKQYLFTGTIKDATHWVDSIVVQISHVVEQDYTPTDTLALVDNISLSIVNTALSENFSDAFSLSDSFTIFAGGSFSISDSFFLLDTLTFQILPLGSGLSLLDILVFSDSSGLFTPYTDNLVEAISFQDSIGLVLTPQGSILSTTDTLSLSDGVKVLIDYATTNSDNLILFDSISTGIQPQGSILGALDNFTLSDGVSLILSLVTVVNEGLALVDSESTDLTPHDFALNIGDALQIFDSNSMFSVGGEVISSSSDQLLLVDNVTLGTPTSIISYIRRYLNDVQN